MEEVYRPREDSFLLAKHVSNRVYGHVLDMGTGTGIQAVVAAKKPEVVNVVAVDLNPKALDAAKIRAVNEGVKNKIEFICCDLFEKVENRFDWIIFNAPYLPSEGKFDERSWVGGVNGFELISRFLLQADEFMKEKGTILLVYSSKTGLNEDDFGFKWEILEKRTIFFETIFCASLTHYQVDRECA